jgi:TM2 domain-containing protein
MPEPRSELVPYDDDEQPLSSEAEVSERSRAVALILGVPLGMFGLPRFYVGRWQSGLLQLVTFGGMGIWWLYDLVLICAGDFRDTDDRPLRRWGVAESGMPRGGSTREVRQLAEQVEALRREVGEIAERVDFTERMLAQQKERMRLPPG